MTAEKSRLNEQSLRPAIFVGLQNWESRTETGQTK